MFDHPSSNLLYPARIMAQRGAMMAGPAARGRRCAPAPMRALAPGPGTMAAE